MAQKFFYVCVGLFLLALTYHLGARSASAQAPSNPIVAVGPGNDAITANGDVYYFNPGATGTLGSVYKGNLFGAPTATTSTSWGKVKADYRK